MLSASFYIIVCSARNRMRKRLERLRQPRYLAGAAAAMAYFYFSIFGPLRANRARAARRGLPNPALAAGLRLAAYGPALLGVAMLGLSALAWVLPFDSGLLEFSDAEMQILVPAPVSRKALLVHRMLRVQAGMLFGAVITGLVFSAAGGYSRLRTALSMWVLLFTMKMYFTGVTLVRAQVGSARREDRGAFVWLPLIVSAGITAVVVGALVREFLTLPVSGLSDVLARFQVVATTGVTRVLLWPFVAIVRPVFVTGLVPFLSALAAACGVLAVMTLWVLESDHAFQDAMADLVARRAGARAATGTGYSAGFLQWHLAAAGRPEAAFMWKAALQTFRIVDRRSLARLLVLTGTFLFIAVTIGRRNGLAMALGGLAVVGAIFTTLMAPQMLRVDLRQDLRHLEVLKTWPVRAGAVIRGQMLWPGVFLSAIVWIVIAVALLLSATVAPRLRFSVLPLESRLWSGLAAMVVAPALIFAQLLIHNGVALFFPGWIQTGKQRSRGLDAMGQRLIMLGGTWLVLVVMALPGAVAGGLLWFAFRRFIGTAALLPAACVVTATLAIEVLLGSEALGPAYERLDVLAVERADD